MICDTVGTVVVRLEVTLKRYVLHMPLRNTIESINLMTQ